MTAGTGMVESARHAPLLSRRFGNREWDAVLRATMVIGLLAIPVIALVPGAEPYVVLALFTLWFRGPLGVTSLMGMEPMLMMYGRLYPVWLVTLVAAVASAYAEVISLHLMRGVMAMRMLERARGNVAGSRMMRLFNRRPAVAIAVTAFSPIPDWITRTLAAVSRYPAARYVVADTIGRLPKLWIPAALGSVFLIPSGLLVAVIAGSLLIGTTAAWWRWRSTPRGSEP